MSLEAGRVAEPRIWLGGVASVPWRAASCEATLAGKYLDAETEQGALEALVSGATPLPGNGYKLRLLKGLFRDAIESARQG